MYGNELPHTGFGMGNIFLGAVAAVVAGVGVVLTRFGHRRSNA